MQLIGSLLISLISIYRIVLIVYIFMSWFPNARESTVGQFIGSICEPYLEPFRRFIPPLGPLDISPIVAIIVLFFAESGIQALFFNASALF